MKNKSVINTPRNSAVLLPTSGNRARNTLSQLAANHVSSPSEQLQHRLWPIAATRSSCHQSVPVPAKSAHYPIVPRFDPEVSTSVRHKHALWWRGERLTKIPRTKYDVAYAGKWCLNIGRLSLGPSPCQDSGTNMPT